MKAGRVEGRGGERVRHVGGQAERDAEEESAAAHASGEREEELGASEPPVLEARRAEAGAEEAALDEGEVLVVP